MSTLAEVFITVFKKKHNRQFIWKIITNPVTHGGTKTCKPTNILVCLNQKFCCFSFYQTQRDYAHLDQRSEKDLKEAAAAETTAAFYDDAPHFAVPYNFFMERFPDPTDGLLKSVLSFTLILFVYL